MLSFLFLICFTPAWADHQSSFSFSAPFHKDGLIDNWKTFGTAVVEEQAVRLTQNRQSEQGAIWCFSPVNFEDWEVKVSVMVGSSNYLGADGMAIWYTKERGFLGPAFGNKDKWTGFGVVLDSFDNDGHRDNPSIYLAVNDGTTNFEAGTDGKSTDAGLRCTANFRARHDGIEPTGISTLSIKHEQGVLTVFWYPPHSATDIDGGIKCFETRVDLPMGYYFGVTAATGGITDYHYVTSFQTQSLSPIKDLSKFTERSGTRDRNQGVQLTPLVPPVDFTQVLANEMGENRAMATELSSMTRAQYSFALEIDRSFESVESKVSHWNAVTNQRIQNVKIAVNEITAAANYRDNIVQGLEKEIEKLSQGVSQIASQMANLRSLQEKVSHSAVQGRQAAQTTHSEITGNLSSGDSLYNWFFWLIIIELFGAIAFSVWRRRQSSSRKYV